MTRYGDAERAAVADAMKGMWEQARARWSQSLLLTAPVDDPHADGLARLNLRTREIQVNGALITKAGLLDSMEAILAHEVGHHVRYPGTFATHTRMLLLERSLIPIEGYSASNLFTDLMINEHLGRQPHTRLELARIYGALSRDQDWQLDPAFAFYLTIYEELWALPPFDLVGEGGPSFELAYPGCRAEAQLLGQRLFRLGPNIYTQFLFFLSVLTRYLEPKKGEHPESQDPCKCDRGAPGPDDWADALEPNAAERAAIAEARRQEWISKEDYDRVGGESAFERRIGGLPGHGTDDASQVPEVMAAYYRLTAERYLFRPPSQRVLGERVVPSTLEEWEPGESTHDIDWPATLSRHGPVLGRATPLVRERLPDYEGLEVEMWQPRMEIYLDISGSMPDPRTTRNAMTLAAQILTMSAIRAGGWVRVLLYSQEFVRYWDWCRSEIEISRFLMHYIGGGTRFPFEVLDASIEECCDRQPVRVVISDADFDHNYKTADRGPAIIARAAEASASLVLMQHCPSEVSVDEYRRLGASTITVEDFAAFPKMAAELSLSLFGDDHGMVS